MTSSKSFLSSFFTYIQFSVTSCLLSQQFSYVSSEVLFSFSHD
jgi:hypothetical protein